MSAYINGRDFKTLRVETFEVFRGQFARFNAETSRDFKTLRVETFEVFRGQFALLS